MDKMWIKSLPLCGSEEMSNTFRYIRARIICLLLLLCLQQHVCQRNKPPVFLPEDAVEMRAERVGTERGVHKDFSHGFQDDAETAIYKPNEMLSRFSQKRFRIRLEYQRTLPALVYQRLSFEIIKRIEPRISFCPNSILQRHSPPI